MFKAETKPSRDLPRDTQLFSTSEVAEIARVTPRQLQWWDERNVIAPRHKGHTRIYVAEDVAAIAVIAALRGKGLSLQKIRPLIRRFKPQLGPRLAQATAARTRLYLLTDGKSLLLSDEPADILDFLTVARQPLVVIDVTDPSKDAPRASSARG